MKKKNTIVLTGFMGSGKSTIGKILASRLGGSFRDLDHEIEMKEGEKISHIFQKLGENHFRALERHHFFECISSRPLVLAVGGGAIQQTEILEFVKNHTLMVYLNVPEETLFMRLKKDKERPLLRDKFGILLDDEKLREKIRELLMLREQTYLLADVTLAVRPNWSKLETANHLANLLSEYASAATPPNN